MAAAAVNQPDIKFIDCRKEPFKIYGLMDAYGPGPMRRTPVGAFKGLKNLEALAANTAGGRVRFKTDSEYVAVLAKFDKVCHMAHMPLTGSVGMDMYSKEKEGYVFAGVFKPGGDEPLKKLKDEGGYTAIIRLEGKRMRDITINLPLYNGLDALYIGLSPDASLEAAPPYIDMPPVVYYGSSITQGGCASRPGNAYEAIVSRRFNMDFLNLGFSGNAKGEKRVRDFILSLDMSVFVLDYDYNAPDVNHLKRTHYKMYRAVRDKFNDLEIVLATRPDPTLCRDQMVRREVILGTYEKALVSGDKHVRFVDGSAVFSVFGDDSCTVDGVHPNDLGFMCMAKAFGDAIEDALFKNSYM